MSPMNYPDNDVLVNRPLYVRELQDYLAKISTRYPSIPHLATDGIFGPETTASVRAFQELNQLSPTGRVDRITWETIVAVYTRIVRKRRLSRCRYFPVPIMWCETATPDPT